MFARLIVVLISSCFVEELLARTRFEQLLYSKCKGYALPKRCRQVEVCGTVLTKLRKNCVKTYGEDFLATLNAQQKKRKQKEQKKQNKNKNYVEKEEQPGEWHEQPQQDESGWYSNDLEIEPDQSYIQSYNVIDEVEGGFGRSPKITKNPRNVTAPPGGTAQFHCVSTGAPSPQTIIAKVGTNKASGDFQTTTGTSSLSEIDLTTVIETVKEADQGWYRCIARNIHGEASADMYLDVRDLCAGVQCEHPKVCQADYTTLRTSCQCISQCSMANQKVRSPVCASDCQGYFNQCQMKQESCIQGYAISVLYEGLCENWKELRAVIRGGTEARVVYKGDKLELVCDVYGTPKPGVTWYRIDANKDYIKVGEGKVLTFNYTNQDDSSRYVCKATNCIKKEVYSKPVKVRVVSAAALQSPHNTNMQTCAVFGNTHVITFDGSYIPVNVQCDYVLAMECTKGEWLIYSKFAVCGQSTCVEAITIYINRAIVTLAQGWNVAYRGSKVKIREEETMMLGPVSVSFDGLHITASFGSSYGKVWITWDGFSSALITIDPSYYTTCGLCGDSDGNMDNDMKGASLFAQSDSLTADQYAKSWRVDTWNVCSRANAPMIASCNTQELRIATQRCRSVLYHSQLSKCMLDRTVYLSTCIHDVCSNIVPVIEGYSTECQIGMVYHKMCQETTNLPESLFKAGCPTMREIQPIVIDLGCPQLEEPYRT